MGVGWQYKSVTKSGYTERETMNEYTELDRYAREHQIVFQDSDMALAGVFEELVACCGLPIDVYAFYCILHTLRLPVDGRTGICIFPNLSRVLVDATWSALLKASFEYGHSLRRIDPILRLLMRHVRVLILMSLTKCPGIFKRNTTRDAVAQLERHTNAVMLKTKAVCSSCLVSC